MPPLRVISMAWGDAYIKDYLEYCLPAILAEGNLAALVPHFSCEVVLVTESKYFDQVKAHACYQATLRHCPLRLIALDDLVTTRGSYGMAVTYGLFRGFQDLGPRMTECVMVFLNADFILAEHSLGSLVPHLQRGERLLLAPSYCTIAENVKPLLRAQRESQHPVLGLAKRSMAKLILDNRHYTIRAKTVNQRFFHMPQTDQFYWAASEATLLGHQLPVAVVAMKPERYVEEPMALWDYGLIAEFCPSQRFAALGDSDEFLMMELRDRDTAKLDLRLGWPSPEAIAASTAPIITAYTRQVGLAELTLHSEDLPPDADTHRAQLRAFLDAVYARLPEKADSHLNHPQWTYHYPMFHAARARRLAGVPDLPPAGNPGTGRGRQPDPEVMARIDALISCLVDKTYSQNDPRMRELLIAAESLRSMSAAHLSDSVYPIEIRDAAQEPAGGSALGEVPRGQDGLAVRISHKVFGAAPWYRPWHWMHSRTRLAARLAERHALPERSVLFLYAATSVLRRLLRRARITASAPIEVIRDPEALYRQLGREPRFDCCVVEADVLDLEQLGRIFDTVRPLLVADGRLLAVFFNNSGGQLESDPDLIRHAFPACGPARIAYSGCWASVAALEVRLRTFAALQRFLGCPAGAAHAIGLLAAAPLALLSSILERNRTMDNSHNPGKWVTAATVEIEVG